MDGADARAGQQRDGELRRHAHVDGDAIAFLDAEAFERVGEVLHLGVQLGVSQAANLARLALPDDGGLVAARAIEMTVDAVVAQVGLPPTNHFAWGRFHSSTLSQGLNQCSSFAASAQKASGSSMDCL